MPAIDPAALSRSDSISQPGSALSIKKDSATSSLPAPKASKGPTIAPRIDLESIYTNLKAAVGETWPIYKETMTLFVAGMFEHEEYIELFSVIRLTANTQCVLLRATKFHRTPPPHLSPSHIPSSSTPPQYPHFDHLRKPHSRSPRSRGRPLGLRQRQTHPRPQTRLRRCRRTTPQIRNHGPPRPRPPEGQRNPRRGIQRPGWP